jgi:hypothetical protein
MLGEAVEAGIKVAAVVHVDGWLEHVDGLVL